MPKGANNDDQFVFLISCIRHSNNGRISFDEVASECNIVTKGAAAKRYERLMKAHGIHQPQGPTGRDTGVQPLKPKPKRATAATPSDKPAAKKRKRSNAKGKQVEKPKEDESDEDKDVNDSDNENIKQEPEDGAAIKNEPMSDGHDEDADSLDGLGEDVDGDFDVEPMRSAAP